MCIGKPSQSVYLISGWLQGRNIVLWLATYAVYTNCLTASTGYNGSYWLDKLLVNITVCYIRSVLFLDLTLTEKAINSSEYWRSDWTLFTRHVSVSNSVLTYISWFINCKRIITLVGVISVNTVDFKTVLHCQDLWTVRTLWNDFYWI